GRRPKYQEETWQQMRRLLEKGIHRKQVAIIYDVAVSTLYKKFPASSFQS
ncbi:helix-turn-helix domain-containing protein, partial [Escherichia coli]